MLSGILTDGGTILGTSRDKPHRMHIGGKELDMTDAILATYHRHHLDALVCIGGGGTQKNALRLVEAGLNVVTLPKTIDNDICADGSHVRFRHRAADRHRGDRPAAFHGHQPRAHHRGGGDGPPRRLAGLGGRHRRRRGCDPAARNPLRSGENRRGHPPPHPERQALQHRGGGRRGDVRSTRPAWWPAWSTRATSRTRRKAASRPRRNCAKFHDEHVGHTIRLTRNLEKLTGQETRLTILGHLQRGGTPSAADRVFATWLGNRMRRGARRSGNTV